jgi:O-acetyl-ADP-ribose deacetylase
MRIFSHWKNFFERSNPLASTIPLKRDIRPFTGDLTAAQKAEMQPLFVDDYTLTLTFKQHPNINVTIRRQDIFNSKAQVIVNAANTHLGGGGGIDGAIHRQGGAEYAKAHRELQTLYNSHYVEGHAAMIKSGSLKEKYHIDNVIVVAGPQGAASPSKESALNSCYFNALELADEQHKTSIAFPSISTGIFGFPKDRAAAISLKAILDFLDKHPHTTLKTISIHYLPSEPKTELEIYRTHILEGK